LRSFSFWFFFSVDTESGGQFLHRLRDDLRQVKEIIHETGRRERRKRVQIQTIQEVLNACFFPHEPRLRGAFERIMLYVFLDLDAWRGLDNIYST